MQRVFVALAATTALVAGFQRGPRQTAIDDDAQNAVVEDVPLGDRGFETVRASEDKSEMKHFIRRLLSADARVVTDRSVLRKIVKEFVEENRTLADLKYALQHHEGIVDGVGRRAPLSQDGFEQVRKKDSEKGEDNMRMFIRRLASSQGSEVDDEDTFAAFSREAHRMKRLDFESLSAATREATWASPTESWVQDHPSGGHAPLTAAGFKAVLALNSEAEMKTFIERVLYSEGNFARDESGLDSFVRDFSSTRKQSFKKMQEALQDTANARWIAEGLGKTAELSSEGFQSVAEKRNNVLMKFFFRRLAEAEGVEVSDAKLSSLVPFFSGTKDKSTFKYAQEALLNAALE